MKAFRWTYTPEPNPEEVNKLQDSLGINETLCRLLVQRNVKTYTEAKDFFRPSLDQLHNPFLMKDMDVAVNRIISAIDKQEHIMIYGDYDVDGTTAVALLYSFLIEHYKNVSTYIPDRYKEGYGVSSAGIDFAQDNDISLIIALDCGIKAIDKVAYAKEKNIDFIICDHHRPGETLPKAFAVLDPKRSDCSYPFDELSGCGVGFKLVQALCNTWNLPDEEWKPLLDLLAVSIGADIVPIVGENRVLAHFGLQLLNEKPRPGFDHVRKLAGRKASEMDINEVVFMLGPRINAAGRIAHGELAVQFLTATDEKEVEALSDTINLYNTNRKELDKSITLEAIAQIEKQGKPNSTVAYSENWHKGVIGIVASRLVEHFYKPTVVFTKGKEGVLAGSARSVKGFDVYNALDACSKHLLQFGGHMAAAGMTMAESELNAFIEAFDKVVNDTLPENLRSPEIEIDATLAFSDFLLPEKSTFFKILKQFAPFGPKNLAPIFASHHLTDTGYSKKVGEDKSHLRVVLKEPASNLEISGIAFKMGEKLDLLQTGKPLSVLYHIEENEFNGVKKLQLMVKDIRLTEEVQPL